MVNESVPTEAGVREVSSAPVRPRVRCGPARPSLTKPRPWRCARPPRGVAFGPAIVAYRSAPSRHRTHARTRLVFRSGLARQSCIPNRR